MSKPHGELHSRLLTFLDQGISSATNFGGSALAAGLLSSSDFGAFAVAVSVLIIAVGIARSWSGSALLIVAPTSNEDEFRSLLAGSVGVALGIGIAGTVITAGAAWFLDGPVRTALLVTAPLIPLVTTQDAFRYGSLARQRAAHATLNDSCWFVGSVVGLMLLRITDTTSLELALVAAIGTALLGAIAGFNTWRLRPSIRAIRSWIRGTSAASARLAGDFLVAVSYSVVPLVLVTAWNADLDQAGSLRTAQVMMGPLAVLYAASTMYMVPVMVFHHRDRREVVSLATNQTALNVTLATLWMGVTIAIPDRIGVRLFGASWEGAQDLFVVVGIAFVGLAISSGPLTALRSRGQLTANLVTQCIISAIVLTSVAVGGAWFTEGSLRGFAFGNLVGAGVAWIILLKLPVRDMFADAPGATDDPFTLQQ